MSAQRASNGSVNAIPSIRRQPRRLRTLASALGALALALALLWTGGFAWFIGDASQPATPPPAADGIVALTGGADRIETAVRLLEAHQARLLLVSGLSPEAGLAVLARRTGLDPAWFAGRVTLGYRAATTVGNAGETAAWARANGLHTLIVVTASYHMRRALIEIGHALPGVTLYPCPVLPPALQQGGWRIDWLLADEYTKWLAARFGIARLGALNHPRLDPIAGQGRHDT